MKTKKKPGELFSLLDIKRICSNVKAWYPENIFVHQHNGKCETCNGAFMARLTCDNIYKEFVKFTEDE